MSGRLDPWNIGSLGPWVPGVGPWSLVPGPARRTPVHVHSLSTPLSDWSNCVRLGLVPHLLTLSHSHSHSPILTRQARQTTQTRPDLTRPDQTRRTHHLTCCSLLLSLAPSLCPCVSCPSVRRLGLASSPSLLLSNQPITTNLSSTLALEANPDISCLRLRLFAWVGKGRLPPPSHSCTEPVKDHYPYLQDSWRLTSHQLRWHIAQALSVLTLT